MKKKFTFLITALFALMLITLPGVVKGQQSVFNFTSNTWNLPTNTGTTAATNYTDSGTGYTINLYATNAYYYFNNKALLMGKSGSKLTLPAFTYNVKKIEVVGCTGASGKVTQNIYVGTTAVSTATTGATGTNTYLINSNYQSAGNVYIVQVTNGNNTQITFVKVYQAFTVTYDANGGTGTVTDNNTYAQGDEVTLKTNSYTYAGHEFAGWLVKDGSDNTIPVSNNKFTMPASNVTVTAQWNSTGPTASIDPTAWDFGEVTINQTSSKTFSVTHANLTSDLSIAVPAGYSVLPTSIAQNASSPSNVTVTFEPTSVSGNYNGNITISGGGLASNVTASLSGTGGCITAPTLTYTSPVNLTLENGEAEYELSPTGGGNGGSITYEVTTNPGGNGDIIGDNNDKFYAIETGQYVVTATQAANGNYCVCVAEITINVVGTDPTCEILPDIWDFGKVLTDTYVEKTFTVNTANLEGNLTVGIDHTVDGFSVTPTTINQAATSTDVTVRFAPTDATDDLTATLTISGGGLANNVTALINAQGDAGYTVTFNPYTGTCTPSSIRVIQGESIETLPTATADGATFYGWATSKIASTTTAPTSSIVSAPYTPTGNITLHAVYKIAKEFDNTAACTGSYKIYATVSGTDYYATGNISSGKYSSTITAANGKSFTLVKETGYGNNEWALKDGENYVYYVSSTSLGTQASSYKWTITQGAKGTWRATSAITTTRAIIFSNDNNTNKFAAYATSNITSNSAYYDIEFGSASFTYNSETPVAKPTYNIAGGSYTGTQSVTITCTTPDATIYYTTNGSDPTASSTEYTGAITVDETMTIKAIAIKSGMANSTVAYATYTIVPLLTTMDEIFAAATTNGDTPGDVAVSFNNWVVSGISGSDNQIVYVTDNDGKGFIIYKYTNGFALNDKLSGTVAGTPLKLSYGSAQFTSLTASAEGLTVTHDGTITPVEKTISQLTSGVNTGAVVRISNLTYNGSNLVDGSSNTISPNSSLYTYGSSLVLGHDYSSVTGVFVMSNSTKQIHPRSAADIVEVEYNIALNDVPSGCTIGTSGDITTAKYGQTVTLTQSAGDGYRFISWSVMNGETPVPVTNNAFTMPKGAVTVSATFGQTYDITCNVTPANTGTVTAEPNPAIKGETVTLTIEPETGYALKSITAYKTGESSTPVTITENTITMPAYGVTVAAEFATEYSVTYNVNGGTGDPVVVKYGAGATVNAADVPVAWTAPTGKLFKNWKTVASGEGDEYEVGDQITDNIAANYVLYAQWRDIVYHITYNVNGDTSETEDVAYGGSTTYEPSLSPLTFLGWSKTSATSSDYKAPYQPTGTEENITLYAVFGSTGTDDFEITAVNSGISNAYKDNTEFEIDGIDFTCNDICKQGSSTQYYIQMKSSGYIYNDDDNCFGKITSVVITYNNTSTSGIVKFGTEYNPSSATAVEGVGEDDYTYTYTPASDNDYGYIRIGASATIQINSIVINYETAVPVTVITGEETLTSLPATPVVVANGGVLTFTGTNTDNTKLIIEDGGQLITNNSVKATVKRVITGHGAKATYDGWTFIASPVVVEGGVNPAAVSGMINATATKYDLYRFNDGVDKEWENYKNTEDHPNFTLVNGKGYLYANEDGTSLDFAGDVNPSTPDINVSLQYTEGQRFAGWNLVGNPFTADAYITNMSYYKMENDGEGNVVINPSSSFSGAIKPCEGVMVKANDGGENVTFTTTEPEGSANNGNINIALAQIQATRGEKSLQTLDNAIVSFNEGSELGKFYFGTQKANIYIPLDNEEYAIVSAEACGEMPVNFKAVQDGQYTITVNPENVEMGYLHLIDNIAGTDIDLLANPSYTFNAKADDYKSRFRLVFSAKSDNDTNLNEDFAFFSDGQLIVTGEGTLQVVDMMGRVISSEIVNGTTSKTIDAKAGVYVLRLINGENVKTQKIVVR